MGSSINSMGGMGNINNMCGTGMSAMDGKGGLGEQVFVTVVQLLTKQPRQLLAPNSVAFGI